MLKSSLSCIPKIETYKKFEDVNKFLANFAMRCSSVDFISNRASWLSNDGIKEKAY